MGRTRVCWIDWAKVVCIWLMVCCHAGQKGMLLSITYQFHMPAFFIISGFLFHPKGLKNTLVSFVVPILFFSVLTLMWKIVIFGGVNPSLIEGYTVGYVAPAAMSPFQGYWFVAVLLMMRLIMECRICRDYKSIIAIACVIYCFIEPRLSIPSEVFLWKPYHIMSCMPLFVLGMEIKERQINIRAGSLEFMALLFTVFLSLTLIQGRVDIYEYNYGLNYLLFLANAIIGSYLLFSLCMLLPERSWVQTLSTGTFLILGLHGMIYGYIMAIFHRLLFLDNPYLPLLSGVIVMAICYPLILFFKKYCPIVLGKKH